MEWNKKEIEIFKNIQNQIKAFDNKASILISAFTIVFAIFSLLISLYARNSIDSRSLANPILFFCSLGFSIFTCLLAIFSFVMVILPRKGRKQHEKSPMYYLDVANLDKKTLKSKISDCNLLEQIKNISIICKTKHKWLICGFIFLIPFSLSSILAIISLLL